jgi:hypothetical protein
MKHNLNIHFDITLYLWLDISSDLLAQVWRLNFVYDCHLPHAFYMPLIRQTSSTNVVKYIKCKRNYVYRVRKAICHYIYHSLTEEFQGKYMFTQTNNLLPQAIKFST